MKVGDLIQHRRHDDLWGWGIGMIVDQCIPGTCEARVSVQHHWVIHFPNRKHKESSAEFLHTQVSEGLDKDNLKWIVIS